MAITDWPQQQRPRERLLENGAHVLSDAELLAVFLRVGVKGKSAVDLGRELIGHFGSISKLLHADFADLKHIHGLGQAKYSQLKAVMEIAKRAMHEEIKIGNVLHSPSAVREYLRAKIGYNTEESFHVVFLNIRSHLLAIEEVARGTIDRTSVYPREIIKRALSHNAHGVILAHNHPSGFVEPSHSDLVLTEKLITALAAIDVKVIDHYIVSAQKTYSFSEHGKMPC